MKDGRSCVSCGWKRGGRSSRKPRIRTLLHFLGHCEGGRAGVWQLLETISVALVRIMHVC